MTKIIAIIVPAYNETQSITATVAGLRTIRQSLLDQGFEERIIVIDDGSADDTAEKARAAEADEVVSHRRNMGLGAAVRTGLTIARDLGADIFVKFDADLQHDPHDILKLVDPIVRGEADIVYGERFSNIEYKMPVIRRWGNRVFTGLMRWLTGWPVVDSQPGIFAANLDYLSVAEIPGDYNYTQQVLLDAFLKGMRFAQVPVTFRRRQTGRSFISFRYPYRVLRQIVLVTVITKPMAIFFPLGLAMFVFAGALFTYQVSEWLLGLSPRPVQNVNLVLGAAMFGLQIMMFGILAKLIVMTRQSTRNAAAHSHHAPAERAPALGGASEALGRPAVWNGGNGSVVEPAGASRLRQRSSTLSAG